MSIKISNKSLKKKLKKRLDLLWSEIIKLQAGDRCEKCGKSQPLNSHHLFSRRYINLRYDLDNGFCACVGCHLFAHHNSLEFGRWLINRRGKEWYERLEIKSKVFNKPDLKLTEFFLAETLKKIKEKKDENEDI